MARTSGIYLRVVGARLVFVAVVVGALLLSGVYDQDRCLDAGGRWIARTCEGADYAPIAGDPIVWLCVIPLFVLGLALVIMARRRRKQRAQATNR